MPGLPKLVQDLADFVEVFGNVVESDSTQSWKSTDPWCCQRQYTHAKLEQFTNGMPKDWTTSKLSQKTSKDQVARQESRHRSPEKGRDAECTYSSEIGTVKMDRPCYQDAWWMFAKENPLWRTTSEKSSHGGQKKRYKDTLQAFLKDCNKPTESLEQIAQDRGKWRGLIRRDAGEYEAKKNQRSRTETCEAESHS